MSIKNVCKEMYKSSYCLSFVAPVQTTDLPSFQILVMDSEFREVKGGEIELMIKSLMMRVVNKE